MCAAHHQHLYTDQRVVLPLTTGPDALSNVTVATGSLDPRRGLAPEAPGVERLPVVEVGG